MKRISLLATITVFCAIVCGCGKNSMPIEQKQRTDIQNVELQITPEPNIVVIEMQIDSAQDAIKVESFEQELVERSSKDDDVIRGKDSLNEDNEIVAQDSSSETQEKSSDSSSALPEKTNYPTIQAQDSEDSTEGTWTPVL